MIDCRSSRNNIDSEKDLYLRKIQFKVTLELEINLSIVWPTLSNIKGHPGAILLKNAMFNSAAFLLISIQ